VATALVTGVGPVVGGGAIETAAAATATGNVQDQSFNSRTPRAPATQPQQNPTTGTVALPNLPLLGGMTGWPGETMSRNDRTEFVRLPVITAVEGAPGTASRSMPNWHAMADVARIAPILVKLLFGSPPT